MKILFVSNLYPPNVVGGYERLCGSVAASFAGRGHNVTVLTSCYGATVSRHEGQLVHQALRLLVGKTIYSEFTGSDARRAAINRSNVTVTRQVIHSAQPDVIYCWNLYGVDHSLLETLVASGVPLVLMLTDNWFLNAKNPSFVEEYFRTNVFSRQLSERPLMKMGTQSIMPFDAIFGATFMRDLYIEGGLRFRHSAVVHNGVKQVFPRHARFRQRDETVHPGEINLLFAGRVVDIKGVHTAIEAIPALRHLCGARLRVRLTIVGDAHDQVYLDRLTATAARLGCEQDVVFLPQVAEDALFELFQSHDIYLFPSLYEPFSLTLILALAAGIPTVASRVGGNIEIVREGESGLLFERDDHEGLAQAVAKLVGDPNLRCRLAMKGREIAAGFTFDHMVNGMEAFIASRVSHDS